tara:strand:+ start:1376 stop:1522 length:147 start_codon:yes stop_codon:yes gene_type:complete
VCKADIVMVSAFLFWRRPRFEWLPQVLIAKVLGGQAIQIASGEWVALH